MKKLQLCFIIALVTIPSLSLAQEAPAAAAAAAPAPAVAAQGVLVATQVVNPLLLLGGVLAVGAALGVFSSPSSPSSPNS